MRIPDGEDRVVELRICSRQSGSAGAQVSSSSSAANPTPGSSSPAALPPSSGSAGTQVPLRHRPPRSIKALRRVRKDKRTPSQRLRVLANPELATAVGPRKRKVPYGQPLPGEEGYEEAVALIGSPDDRLLAASDSELIVPPARPLPHRRKMAVVTTSTAQKTPSAESSGDTGQERSGVEFSRIGTCSPTSRVSCAANSADRSSNFLVVDEYSPGNGGTGLIFGGSLDCSSGSYAEFRGFT
ncbi:Hypothetical protein PHPALM_6276 [Phytophthora palmivora]|uniref:Uncharacterized protein n=1 Tax=Phytophthora palmivora TaxID=4796 RepID=A0A2P4YFA6_9STRA|nr:Hypothetical protein PHPALM_6276 [Phytophthora palmivora]